MAWPRLCLGPIPERAATAATGRPNRLETQARQALDNVLTVLAEAGCGLEQVLRVTAYIVGVENWPAFNRVYAEAFGSAKPARTVVPVAELHHGYLIEIEAIGIRNSYK